MRKQQDMRGVTVREINAPAAMTSCVIVPPGSALPFAMGWRPKRMEQTPKRTPQAPSNVFRRVDLATEPRVLIARKAGKLRVRSNRDRESTIKELEAALVELRHGLRSDEEEDAIAEAEEDADCQTTQW